MIQSVRIIGIDPGLRHSGWGIIDCLANRLTFVAAGVVGSNARETLAVRLVELHSGLSAVIATHDPAEAAVEQTFVSKDAVATLKLGQARGIALLVPAQAGLHVAEYAPNVIKKTVVGAGHADKVQIRAMVKILLPRAQVDNEHAADALAIAITHAHHRAARLIEARAVS